MRLAHCRRARYHHHRRDSALQHDRREPMDREVVGGVGSHVPTDSPVARCACSGDRVLRQLVRLHDLWGHRPRRRTGGRTRVAGHEASVAGACTRRFAHAAGLIPGSHSIDVIHQRRSRNRAVLRHGRSVLLGADGTRRDARAHRGIPARVRSHAADSRHGGQDRADRFHLAVSGGAGRRRGADALWRRLGVRCRIYRGTGPAVSRRGRRFARAGPRAGSGSAGDDAKPPRTLVHWRQGGVRGSRQYLPDTGGSRPVVGLCLACASRWRRTRT